MALFDDLSRKLTEAGATAVQKTKEISDMTRLNSAISEEERKINNQYYQIGKLYAAIHMNDYEDDFAGMLQSVVESETKIREYRQQIQDIKGIVKCEKCGAEVPSNAAFCSGCGNAMPKIEPLNNAELIKCSGCGAMIDKSMRFCTSCGKPMVDLTQANTSNDEIEESTKITEVQSRKCPGCGKEVADELAFCTECGMKLS